MTEYQGRLVAFPDVHSFAQLFPASVSFTVPSVVLLRIPNNGHYLTIRSYCGIYRESGSYAARNVSLSKEVESFLAFDLPDAEFDDTLSFSVTEWRNGKALVTANHTEAIGSHYLAIIDAASVPN